MASPDQLKYIEFARYATMFEGLKPLVLRADFFNREGQCLHSSDPEFEGDFKADNYKLFGQFEPDNANSHSGIGLVLAESVGHAEQESIAKTLSSVIQNIVVEMGLRTELDTMAEELGGRYEELNLVYKIKHNVDSDIADSNTAESSLQFLVDDCTAFLGVNAAMIILPELNLRLVSGNPSSLLTNHTIESIAAATKIEGRPFVVNSDADAQLYHIEKLSAVNIVCAPIYAGSKRLRGAFIAIKKRGAIEFSNSDRQLVEIQAEMARKILKQRFDSVTGLMGQAELNVRFRELLRDRAEQCELALFHFNHLRLVADSFGGEQVNKLLVVLADVLASRAVPGSLVARLSYDAFVIVLDGSDIGLCVAAILEDIEEVNSNRRLVPAGAEISVNVGVVTYQEDFDAAEEWLTAGDLSASMAKNNSFQRVHVYSTTDVELDQKRDDIFWLQNVKSALLNRDFQLYCQPMDALSGGPPHYEILLRILDGDGKIISPQKFIEAAERYDLIPNVDQWVVEEVCAKLIEYDIRSISPDSVWSVNLSGKSIGSSHFKRFLVQLLKENTAFSNEQLCFELTETAEIGEFRSALELITEVKVLGPSFSLDDFGCGLSSFSYLKEIPVEYLKIDGSFIKDIDTNTVNLSMVQAMNSVGKLMGLTTIAEFVESESIKRLLKAIGVDYAQGYIVSRPVPLEGVLKDLVKQARPSSTETGGMG